MPTTAQGETIRITGRVANELDGNGGVNWDDRFRRMVDTLLVLLRGGIPPGRNRPRRVSAPCGKLGA